MTNWKPIDQLCEFDVVYLLADMVGKHICIGGRAFVSDDEWCWGEAANWWFDENLGRFVGDIEIDDLTPTHYAEIAFPGEN